MGIAGEVDLVPVALDVQPRGVPAGTVELLLPSGVPAACADLTKYGGRLLSTSWALEADAAPDAVYLEGFALHRERTAHDYAA